MSNAISNLRIAIAPVTYTHGRKRIECEREAVGTLLTELLDSSNPIEYAHQPNGAPYLPHLPHQYLSISHTEGFAMVGISGQPLGVDIERIGRQVQRVQSRFVHDREYRILQAQRIDATLALCILWSAKEAAYKLTNPPNGSLLSFCLEPNILTLEQSGVLHLSDQYSPRLITIEYRADELYTQAIAYHAT